MRTWWSTFRRQHQATAQRCHTERRAREQPPILTGSGPSALRSASCALDDALWTEIAALLPTPRRRGAEPPLAYRVMLEGMLWVAQTGASWQDLPARFGPWKTVHATYHRWKQQGQWPAVLARLQAAAPAPPDVSL